MLREKLSKGMLFLATAMIGPLFIVAIAAAEIERPDLGDMKQARKQAAHRPRRIIYNDDGNDVKPYATPEELISIRVRQVANTQVDSIYYCTGGGGLFWAHQPQVGEVVGEFVNESSAQDAKSMRDGLIALKKLGTDPLAVVVDYGHKNNKEVFWSYRMNNPEDSYAPWGLSRRKREHPELVMGVPSDWSKYPQTHPKAWWAAWDFAKPEVRDYLFRICEDVCQRYDIDGIELDFIRQPLYFRPNLDGRPAEPQHVEMMTDLVRHIRAMTERVSLERGRPLLVTVRTPLSVRSARDVGLDIPTYLEEDLMDIMIAGVDYNKMSVLSAMRNMIDLGHKYQVPVYALMTPLARGTPNTLEAWRGAAMTRWYCGADGIYTFNLFPKTPDPRFKEIGSMEMLKGLDKLYAMDRLAPDTILGNFRLSVVMPNRLPVALVPNDIVTVKLPVGEDIVANAPVSKAPSTRLRFHISNLVQGDQVSAKFNGRSLDALKPVKPLTDEPAGAWFEIEIDPKWVQAGYNLVDVRLTPNGKRGNPAALEQLALAIKYKEKVAPVKLLPYKKTDKGELSLHVFNPLNHKATDKRPCIVFFFGGGWTGGTPRQFYQQAKHFAARGMVAVSAEYRVKNVHGTTPFECVEDGKSAIRYVRQHADELGIDPNRIVASGGSAGGHVAACTGVIAGLEEEGEDVNVSSVPNAMILFNPCLDTTEKGYGLELVGVARKTENVF